MKLAFVCAAAVLLVTTSPNIRAAQSSSTSQSTFPSAFVPIEIRRFVVDNAIIWDHITGSPGQYGPPYNDEGHLGWISSQPFPGSRPLYVCRNNALKDEYFTSASAQCESRGSRLFSPYVMGHVASQQIPGTVALYRCVAGKNEFDSTNPTCEGQRVVGVLGYLFP